MYAPADREALPMASSSVTFSIAERPARWSLQSCTVPLHDCASDVHLPQACMYIQWPGNYCVFVTRWLVSAPMCPAFSTVSLNESVSALEEVTGANKLMNTVGCERMRAGWPCGWSTALAQRMGCSMGLKGWRPTSCPSGMACPSPSPCEAHRSVCMHLPCNVCVCVCVHLSVDLCVHLCVSVFSCVCTDSHSCQGPYLITSVTRMVPLI